MREGKLWSVETKIARVLDSIGLLRPAYQAVEFGRTFRTRVRARRFDPPSIADDGLSIPPPLLITKVAGGASVEWFLTGGKQAAESIGDVLARHGLAMRDFGAVLDFGCGCGRVIRHWHPLESTTLHGTDYNESLIAWSRANLPFAHFETNRLDPPLRYDDGQFDFIYALSVFTHLNKALQFSWLRELKRVLKPGGYLLITTHGERFLDSLTPEEQKTFRSGQLVVRWDTVAGTNMCGAYQPRAFVEHSLARDAGLEVVDFVPEGAKGNVNQDIYLLHKPLESSQNLGEPKSE